MRSPMVAAALVLPGGSPRTSACDGSGFGYLGGLAGLRIADELCLHPFGLCRRSGFADTNVKLCEHTGRVHILMDM